MRLIRSLNPNDYSYNKRINGLISAKDCQEIEELRRIWCEETDRAGQARIDELIVFASKEKHPTTVSQLLTQVQDLQNKVLVRRKRILRS